MAGSSMTFTEVAHGTVKKIKAAWVSDDATGAVSGTTSNVYAGRLIGLATVPGTVATQPTDNYDITIADTDGVDLALGAGANRDNVNTEFVAEASMAGVAHSKLTIAVTNAGNAKAGTIYIYIR
jgi:hypothetical protein